MNRVYILLSVALVVVLCCSHVKANVNLEWDASTDNVGVTGYELHYGNATGIYTDMIDVGDVLAYTFVSADNTYFFVVLAYDAKGNKSGFSNEVSDYIDTSPPTIPGMLRIVP